MKGVGCAYSYFYPLWILLKDACYSDHLCACASAGLPVACEYVVPACPYAVVAMLLTSSSATGFDLSYFQGDVSASDYGCLKSSGYTFGIIEATAGTGGYNQYCMAVRFALPLLLSLSSLLLLTRLDNSEG